MDAQSWLSRLRALPRLQGQVQLNAYDSALRQLFVTQYIEYDGKLLCQDALEAGLLRAISEFPVVTGSIEELRADNTLLLIWDTHNQASSSSKPECGFSWSYAVQAGPSPSIFSAWELWCKGAMPSIHPSQVAAAKVTVFPEANKSILIFTFDHALFDVPAANRFLQCWLQEAAARVALGSNKVNSNSRTAVEAPICRSSSVLTAGTGNIRDIAGADSIKKLGVQQIPVQDSIAAAGSNSSSSSVSLQDWRISTEAIGNEEGSYAATADGDTALNLYAEVRSAAADDSGEHYPCTGAGVALLFSAANTCSSNAGMILDDPSTPVQDNPLYIGQGSHDTLAEALQCKLSSVKPAVAAVAHAVAAVVQPATSYSIFDRMPYSLPTGSAFACKEEPAPAGTQQHQPEAQQWPDLSCKQSCKDWLDRHRGNNSPFPWDPLDHAQYSEMGWKTHPAGLKAIVSVWKIPQKLLQDWKAAATAAAPLPDGMWYSSNTATAAMLAATMYAAAPDKYQQQGGMHVGAVVDIRGGRCGLNIPHDSATNASIWGLRTWVPVELLEAAAGQPSPALMHHLRIEMQRELKDPAGMINKQFAWYAAAQVVGAAPQVQLCQGLQQVDHADMMLDWLPQGAADLPAIPETSVSASTVRFPPCFFDRVFMAIPVPCASGKGCDIQIEVTLPRSIIPHVFQTWEQLGVQRVAIPSIESKLAALGWYWQPLDFLVHPHMLKHLVYQKWGKLHCLLGRWACSKAGAAAEWLAGLVPFLPCTVG